MYYLLVLGKLHGSIPEHARLEKPTEMYKKRYLFTRKGFGFFTPLWLLKIITGNSPKMRRHQI